MGILNVTPDSFSDGGLYFDKSTAVKRAFQMVEEGADIIDRGGESTRPGSEPITIEEELRRTIPVIESLSKKTKIPLCIDTYKSEVPKQSKAEGHFPIFSDKDSKGTGCRIIRLRRTGMTF